MYVLKINGVKHTVTRNSEGLVYDPPLTESERDESRLQDMISSKRGPGLSTETNFWAGRGTLAEQWKDDPVFLDVITKNVKARGGDVTANSVYFQSLVRPGFKDGDPEAMVSPAEGTAKIRKIMEKRGIGNSEGHVKVKPRTDVDTDPIRTAKPMANDIVERLSAEYKAKDPVKYGKMKKQELREIVIDKHSPKR